MQGFLAWKRGPNKLQIIDSDAVNAADRIQHCWRILPETKKDNFVDWGFNPKAMGRYGSQRNCRWDVISVKTQEMFGPRVSDFPGRDVDCDNDAVKPHSMAITRKRTGAPEGDFNESEEKGALRSEKGSSERGGSAVTIASECPEAPCHTIKPIFDPQHV